MKFNFVGFEEKIDEALNNYNKGNKATLVKVIEMSKEKAVAFEEWYIKSREEELKLLKEIYSQRSGKRV